MDGFNAISPPNVNQEVSNTNHFGSVSDSLHRLAAASECMASVRKLRISLGIMMYLNLILHWQRTHTQKLILGTEL